MQVTKLNAPPVHVADIKVTQEELDIIFKSLGTAFDVSNFNSLLHSKRLTYEEGCIASQIRSNICLLVRDTYKN